MNMLGAIAGDIIGSTREVRNVKTTDFNLFPPRSRITDDSVMTIAVADVLLKQGDYVKIMQTYGREYPDVGYGSAFKSWIKVDFPEPYNSWGNGSAMRVSPVGWAGETLDWVLDTAKASAEVSHNHPEGIKGAQAVAVAVFLAKNGASKIEIKQYVETQFGYDLNRTIEAIRPNYTFDVSCQGSVPEALIAFLESTDFERAIRLAISIGGDSDTIASIAGGVAHAFYKKIPDAIAAYTWALLSPPLEMVTWRFMEKYNIPY
jgi:ADP-ribosylglycohydrolase